VNKNSGQGKGYPNSDETFQDDFNELLSILIVLNLIEILGNSHPDQIRSDPLDPPGRMGWLGEDILPLLGR
jgi:hypothetical protein